MTRRQRRANLLAALIGAAAAGAVVLFYFTGQLDWIELKTLDLRFRYANSIPQHSDITCIDIDDSSLELVGRWPWPRDVQAALISVPAELGAAALLLDITWVEPETQRTVTTPDTDLLGDPLEQTEDIADAAFPDYELRTALASAGNAYLAFHFASENTAGGQATSTAAWLDAFIHSDAFDALVEAAKRDDDAKIDALAADLHLPTGHAAAAWPAARMVAALVREPGLDDAALAERLHLSKAAAERLYDRCLQAALRRIVNRWLAEDPTRAGEPPAAGLAMLHARLSQRPFEDDTPLRRALLLAYREALGYAATIARPLATLERVAPIAAPAAGVAPVYFLHARAAKRCGFVVFEPDEDGTIRRQGLFARQGGDALAQLAFALGCDRLNVGANEISVLPERVRLTPPGRAPLELQLDSQGRTLVPWVARGRWTDQFKPHVSASAILEIRARRMRMAHNERIIQTIKRQVFTSSYFGEGTDYQELVAALDSLRDQLRIARYRGQDESIVDLLTMIQNVEFKLSEMELNRHTALLTDRNCRAMLEKTANAPGPDRVTPLLEQLDHLQVFYDANRTLQHEIEAALEALRPRITGKLCLIGYTATSLADFVPTPTDKRAPGVSAHANLLNGLLTGRLVHWTNTPINAAIAMAMGLAATLISIWRGPRSAVVLLLLLLGAFVALAGWLAFYRWTYWIALTPAIGAALASYAAIAFYRYVFIDRERRQLSTALGQYTSKEIARQVAENADLCRRAETREVTAIFTDLRGFTPISERIGAERTQRVLNICLERFTRIMLRHEAMVNKFLGDGVFAFWNPVIYPQLDHALRACDTAIDLQVGLRELIEEQRRGGGDEVFGELALRIGVASGMAVVGPCGSEQKYDYTCIGDSVNLASRLESANKFYGTTILVNETTRNHVGDRFVFRPLGGVRVKGKQAAVQVFELLGRTGAVEPQLVAYAERFGAAVAVFQQRQWAAARAAFEACLTARPDDLAAQRYVEALAVIAAAPPAADWSAALELTEK